MLQDTKSIYRNQFHFDTLTINYPKKMKKTIPFTITSKICRKKKLNIGYYGPGHERNRKMLVKGHIFL